MESKNIWNKNKVLGGIIGGVIAATAALLLAPKSGLNLLRDLMRSLRSPHKKSIGLRAVKKSSSEDLIHSHPKRKMESISVKPNPKVVRAKKSVKKAVSIHKKDRE